MNGYGSVLVSNLWAVGWDLDRGMGWGSCFFYVAKASKSEKGEGNVHPTVKPIKLITPPAGIVLDPFMRSGSTGIAYKNLGFEFIGIERELEYFEIATKRLR